MNSLVSSRKTPTSGLCKSFRIRSNACTNSTGGSARITPRLPESASGLSTQGKVISPEAMSWSGFACKGDLLKAGTFSPASRNRSRERYLSRQMSVASGGCPRKPSLWQARAPVDVGRSPMETIASRGLDAAKSQILCAEASGSSKRRGRAPSCHGSSSTWQRSVPKVMDSPNFCAASIKAHVWYPVVVHNKRSLLGWEVPIMAGPNRCNQFSSRAQPPPVEQEQAGDASQLRAVRKGTTRRGRRMIRLDVFILFMEDGRGRRRVRLVVLGRINGLPDNVVVDLFGRLGFRWLGRGYNRGRSRFRLLRRRRRRS